MQVIYQGSYCEVKSPQIRKNKYKKDFGEGFYCTVLKEQAIKWARKYDTNVLNYYEYNETIFENKRIYSYDKRMVRLYC